MKFCTYLLLFAFLALVGCDENLDPTEPDGAYNVFKNALFAGDTEAIWNQLAPTSHKYFDDQYDRLTEMDATIAKYLPPTDHKIARSQAGSILTDEVTDGKSLFMKVFDPSQATFEPAHKVGANVEEIQVSEDKQFANVKNAAGETWSLQRSEVDDIWRVQLVRSKASVQERMKWLEDNQTALQQTVEDLIEEETTKREKIIAELMGLE